MGTELEVLSRVYAQLPDSIGGARRDRTADLLHAMQALSQLSYGPTARPPHATQRTGCCQAEPGADLASAASMRSKVRARPRSSSVTSMGGETAVPVTATRSGCATLPRPLCSRVAMSLRAACIAKAFH